MKIPLINNPITSIFRQKAEALFHKKAPPKEKDGKVSQSLNLKNEIEILRAELDSLYEELDFQNKEKAKSANELVIANTELKFQQGEKQDRADELVIANTELEYQQGEKQDRADELVIANTELKFQQGEKQDRADELVIANTELKFQQGEKQDRADELDLANTELIFQQGEKKDRADELDMANKELCYQQGEKQKRQNELHIANAELKFQQGEKQDRADELVIANTELKFQQGEKQDRADELVIANTELEYQQGEKQDRADELAIINKEHKHQRKENDRITDELIVINAEQTAKKERLNFIIQGSNLGTWEWNIKTGETIFNERLANIIGYTLAEISPTNFSTFVKFTHPDDVLLSHDLLEKHFKKELLHYSCELRMKHRKGHWVWLLETGSVHLWDAEGKPVLMAGTHKDITEHKIAEEKILESEERFRLMANTAPVLIWMSDANSMCNYFNKSWLNFTGRTLAEEIGEGWMKYVHPDDLNYCLAIYNKAIKSQQEFKMEFRLLSANSEYGWLLNHGVPRFENDGTFLGYIGSCVEITVSKQLQITLAKYTKDLEISNTELENFAFIASHDLKEPLRMVNSYLGLLEIKLGNQLDEKTSKYIHYASDGASRMKILIDNLLQYSSVIRNKDPFIQLDLNEELNYIQLILKDTIENNHAVLHFHPMPIITANKTLINELFINIINNALKYRDETDPIIEVGYTDELTEFVFYIKDNGIGIREKDFDKIFILFSRLHNKNTYSGTGIGLAQCKKIVEIHKGKIWLKSKIGEGSTFFFSIPKFSGLTFLSI